MNKNDTDMNSKEKKHINITEEVLVSIRKITQAIDLHSRALVKKHGVTGPQLIVLREIEKRDRVSISEVAAAVNLSVSTITGIITRLEKRNLVTRQKSREDKRRVLVQVTDKYKELSQNIPQLLQDRFVQSFNTLATWEKMMIISSLQRLVTLMSAEEIDASPILATGPIDQQPEQSNL